MPDLAKINPARNVFLQNKRQKKFVKRGLESSKRRSIIYYKVLYIPKAHKKTKHPIKIYYFSEYGSVYILNLQ